ncbi:CBR1 [Symbiodinium sp. CCMP2592]|nr:CBR1 [Symbiodinium sp. CCMP2592]
MAIELEVCHGGKCARKGGGAMLLRDIEEVAAYAGPSALVTASSCLRKCSKGPNCRESTENRVFKRLKKFSRVEAMLADIIPGFEMNELQRKIFKLKFAARRAEAADRMENINKALSLLGPEKVAAQEPRLLAQLLVMRSQELIETDSSMALLDAQKAVHVLPSWAFGQFAFAQALQAHGRFGDAVCAVQAALSIGRGIDKRALKKTLAKLQKQVVTEPNIFADHRVADIGTEKSHMLEWQLSGVRTLNHDCLCMKFWRCGKAAPFSAPKGRLDPVWHVEVLADIGCQKVSRPYTPISTAQHFADGQLQLVVKVYPEGLMTQHLAGLRLGERIVTQPPLPTLPAFEADRLLGGETLAILAGGSAVTLALQVCAAALDRERPRKVHLVLCNKTAKDVLFAEDFEEFLQRPGRFQVTHLLSRESPPPPSQRQPRSSKQSLAVWKGPLHLSEKVLDEILPNRRAAISFLVSGPPGLCRTAQDALRAKGHLQDALFLDEFPEAEAGKRRRMQAPARRGDGDRS